jgi:hypothetical protein
MSTQALAIVGGSATTALASIIGVSPQEAVAAIKAQCFKANANNVTDAQLVAFISIAKEMGVNPLIPGMLYAYPNQGGITPIMGPDGVYKKLGEHPEVDTWETTVFPEDPTQDATHATARIWRKGREKPLTYTAILKEWKVQANPNWNSRPRHMLSIRALKQCARQIIHGIPFDEDERHIMGEINVTPAEAQPQAEEAKPEVRRSRRGGAGAAKDAAADEAKPADTSIDIPATPVQDAKAEVVTPAAPAHAPAPTPAPAPAVEAKPEPVVDQFAGMPELAPGIGIKSWMGRPYPTKVMLEITGVQPALTPAGKACAKVGVKCNEFQGDVVSWDGVESNGDNTVKITNNALRVGAKIIAQVSARPRPKKGVKNPDGTPIPDTTQAPNIFISEISEVAPTEEI